MVFIVSSILCFNNYRESYQNKQLYEQLLDEVNDYKEPVAVITPIPKADVVNEDLSPESEKTESESKEPVILKKYQDLYNENPDIDGWINIRGIADYPVMIHKEDSDYYLHKDFNKKDSKYGSVYLNNECDLNLNSSISLVYGHNMKDGSMFGKLDKYLDKDFFEQNRIIELDTLYEENQYEVVGVFLSRIYNQDELDVFKYYNYKGTLSEEEFNDYKNGVSQLLKIGDLSNVKYGDTLVELITCSYHTEDGKLVVLCKKIEK
jgi:sortase B